MAQGIYLGETPDMTIAKPKARLSGPETRPIPVGAFHANYDANLLRHLVSQTRGGIIPRLQAGGFKPKPILSKAQAEQETARIAKPKSMRKALPSAILMGLLQQLGSRWFGE